MGLNVTYSLVVSLESHEYAGDFYFIGDEYQTPGDVLEHVAADHIHAIERRRRIEEYLLGMLGTGENASQAEYEAAEPDIECRLHIDVNYGRFWFDTGDEQFELPIQPTRAAIEEVAHRLDS